ncbi:MAG: serine protein kinase RIO [Methanocalculaceae archaeon]|jgi:RIO kinase 1|nr:serine protein kinase RIO [Methanocalculaceae archaeon]
MRSTPKPRDHHHENFDRIERLDRKLANLGIKIRKDEDSWKVTGEVFDETTLFALYKLVNKKVISSMGGSISTGKEANVFFAGRISISGEETGAAAKIYRIRTGNFTAMSEYILGDPRFSNIRHTHKDIIFAWTKKEYSNLSRIQDAGISGPEPFAFDRNILIMEFLGENGIPYPQMRQHLPGIPEERYAESIGLIRDLYQKARLIHGDLSEYNILTGPGGLVLIDMAQAVTPEHPKAYSFLLRDIKNINRFFATKCETTDERELFRSIVGEEFFEI